jgi:hypothetical protein
MRDIQTFIKREFLLLFILLIFLINPYFKGVYICYILAFYFLTLKFRFFITNLDKKGILLLLFSISYSIIYSFNTEEDIAFIALYAISPITFYFIGKYFSTYYPSYKVYYFLFLFLTLGYSLIPAVSIIKHIIENGFTGSRNLSLLWVNHVDITATILGAYFTLNMAALGTIFVKKTTSFEKRIKFISLGTFIISLFCVLRVASRTQLAIAGISIFLTLIYLMFKQSFKRNFYILLTIIIVFIFFSKTISNSVYFNILNERNNSTEELMKFNGRSDLWLASIENITKNPFGWGNHPNVWVNFETEYSHNLWLDVARLTGIIPLVFLCFFTISCISLVMNTLKLSQSNIFFNISIITSFAGFMTVFFVEPVIEGLYLLFLIFCFYIGILSGYVKS